MENSLGNCNAWSRLSIGTRPLTIFLNGLRVVLPAAGRFNQAPPRRIAGKDVDAIVLLVCDQPFVDDRVIKQLIPLHEKARKPIVASSYADTLGVPALFERVCFRELLSINGQRGLKSIILPSRERVAELSFPKGKIDIDTAEDWEQLKSGV
jgi:CTP:molybdopterin cytidylyltransferase MocA